MDEIVNRVEKSGLKAVDLADFLPKDDAVKGFDFSPYLWNELVLKEKDFREFCKKHDWDQYSGKHVYLFCSTDAILPSWAYMLVSSLLIGKALTISVGGREKAVQSAVEYAIQSLNPEEFSDAKLIVKGCSDIPEPEKMMALFLQKVQPVASSVMFGEPCSTVPIYKRPKVKET